MAREDAYIEKVLGHVWAPAGRLARFETDLRGHFEQGTAAGETEAQVIARLGDPEEVAAAFMEGTRFEYAGFWERLFAFVGDVGFLFLAASPILLLGSTLAQVADRSDKAFPAALVIAPMILLGVALVGVGILYFPILEAHFGKTPGKHLMKIRVRTESGGKVGLGAAFLRRLSLYFEILVLDALFVPFTEKKQRAFDMVAKTVVLREPGSRSAGRFLVCLLPWVFFGLIVLTAVLLGGAVAI